MEHEHNWHLQIRVMSWFGRMPVFVLECLNCDLKRARWPNSKRCLNAACPCHVEVAC